MEYELSYKLTEAAENDLDDVVSYITYTLNNPKAAADFVDNLQIVINRIRRLPKCGTIVDNEFLKTDNVRKTTVKNYILYYYADETEDTIYVLRIVYGRRNMDEILNSLDF